MKCAIGFAVVLMMCGATSARSHSSASKSQASSVQPAQAPAQTTPPQVVPPAAAAEFAHLRVYRARRFKGSALAPSIFVDDKPVAKVGNGRRVTIKVSPGQHAVKSDDKSSAITLDLKAGQDYYVRVDEEEGFWKGHGKLTLVLAEQGGPEFKLQKPIEEDRKLAKDMIEQEVDTPPAKKD